MKCFFINLDRSPDRLAFMQSQARSLGLDSERIAAVEGAAAPPAFAPQFEGAPLLPGEIGCYASHLLAAQTIVNRGLPYAVVSEDDVPFAPSFAEIVEAAVASAPPGWDFIHLSSYNSRALVGLADLGHGHRLVRYTRLPKNTVAYVISQSGARKWLQPTKRAMPSDVEIRYAWKYNLDVLGIFPEIAFRNRNFGSAIDPSMANRIRDRKRKWAPSIPSRIYGAVWQTRKLGLKTMVHGQLINALNALRGQDGSDHPAII